MCTERDSILDVYMKRTRIYIEFIQRLWQQDGRCYFSGIKRNNDSENPEIRVTSLLLLFKSDFIHKKNQSSEINDGYYI